MLDACVFCLNVVRTIYFIELSENAPGDRDFDLYTQHPEHFSCVTVGGNMCLLNE